MEHQTMAPRQHPQPAELATAQTQLNRLRGALHGVLFGQQNLIETVLTGLLAGGHMLLEGLPGLGKTELVKGLSKAIQLDAKRIQFTPDLLPGDITGNPMLQELNGKREFVFRPGPIFAHLVLADEINRASPKTQSALLEAMQERRVTVMGESHPLPEPFFVLATQNPIELEGTYPLPEAQLDRFLFKVDVGANPVEVLERIVTERELGVEPVVEHVMTRTDLLGLIALARRIFLPDVVANYIARLVDATHPGRSIASAAVKFGASPRAALGMAAAVKARALIEGRMNASFEDVQAIARAVLQHRVIVDYTARLAGRTPATVIEELVEEIPMQDRSSPASIAGTKL
jgi:MoxR-like ATPase